MFRYAEKGFFKVYPRAQKFSRFIGARGHIRATTLADHSAREYKRRNVMIEMDGVSKSYAKGQDRKSVV